MVLEEKIRELSNKVEELSATIKRATDILDERLDSLSVNLQSQIGEMPIPNTFILYVDEELNTVAYNVNTKQIFAKSQDAVDVVQACIDSVIDATTWYNKLRYDRDYHFTFRNLPICLLYFKPGLYATTQQKRVQVIDRYVIFKGEGAIVRQSGPYTELISPYYRSQHGLAPNLLFGIDCYNPSEFHNLYILGSNDGKPAITFIFDPTKYVNNRPTIAWVFGFKIKGVGLLRAGLYATAINASAFPWDLWNCVIEDFIIHSARPGLVITKGDASGAGVFLTIRNGEIRGCWGAYDPYYTSQYRYPVHIDLPNWQGEFKNILAEGNGKPGEPLDHVAIYINTYGTAGLEIANIGVGDGSNSPWDMCIFSGRQTTVRHLQMRNVIIGGRLRYIAGAGNVLAFSPGASHSIKFEIDPGSGINTIKILQFNNRPDDPTLWNIDVPMELDFNDFFRQPVTVTSANSPYYIFPSNIHKPYILVDASGGNVTINIIGSFARAKGTIYVIKRIDTSPNTVTVTGTGFIDDINIATNPITLNPFDTLRFTGTGTAYQFIRV